MPNPAQHFASRLPMAPSPTMPTVRPHSSTPVDRTQRPDLVAWSRAGSFRAAERMSPMASSATPWALTPGVLVTVMPRRRAEAMSTASHPAP